MPRSFWFVVFVEKGRYGTTGVIHRNSRRGLIHFICIIYILIKPEKPAR